MRVVGSPKSRQAVAGLQNLKRRRKTTIQAFWSQSCFEIQTSICQEASGQDKELCSCKLEPYFLLTVDSSLTIERFLSCSDGGLFHLEEIVTSQLRIPLPIVWSSPLSQKAPASTPGGQVTQTSQRVKPSTDQGCQRLDVALFPKYCPRSELIFVATVVEIRRRNVFRKEFKILFTS